jgi:cysteine desulfurase / selenocysteine lyase
VQPIELLAGTGVQNIARELLRKPAWLIPALQTKGCTVLQPSAPPENSGPMITFFRGNDSMSDLHARLEQHGIVTSLRADRRNQQYLRIAPHFYNTDAELERLLEQL